MCYLLSQVGICAGVQEERDGLVASIRSGVVQSRMALVHASTVAEKDLERGGGADLCGPGKGGFFPAGVGSRDIGAAREE